MAYGCARARESSALKKDHRIDDTRDMRGKVLMPGLINCHTHTAETMYRGRGHDYEFPDWMNLLVYPVNQVMEEDEEDLFYHLAQLNAMEAIANARWNNLVSLSQTSI